MMEKLTTTGIICFRDSCNILYKISKIEYEEYENGEYEYIFTPFYNVIDFLPSSLFQGIPGLDLSLRKEHYHRKNMVPVFISERTPGENREDLRKLLEDVGMESLDRLEWLIRTKTQYSGDNLFVIPFETNETVVYEKHSMYDLVKRADNINKALLSVICAGDYLHADDITIDDSTRASYYRLLLPIYTREYEARKRAQRKGIEKAKEDNVYKGRKKIKMDSLLLINTMEDYVNKKITLEEALTKLKISRATFFRRLKDRK